MQYLIMNYVPVTHAASLAASGPLPIWTHGSLTPML